MKALEMLYRDKKWIEEECDISKIPIERVQTMIKDLVEINEAIAELEALQQPKNCDGCRSKSCSVKRILLELGEINSSYFYCNDYEPKEQ